MMNKNRIKLKNGMLTLIFLVISVFSFSVVGASLGVGISDHIEVYPGEIKETNYYLQNVAGSQEDYVVAYNIEEGAEYVHFIEENFDLGFGEEKAVGVEISVPSDVPVGTVIPVSVLFMPRTSLGDVGGAQIITNLRSKFNVIVVEKPQNIPVEMPQKKSRAFVWILAIVIVLLIIWWLVSISKKKNSMPDKIVSTKKANKRRKK